MNKSYTVNSRSAYKQLRDLTKGRIKNLNLDFFYSLSPEKARWSLNQLIKLINLNVNSWNLHKLDEISKGLIILNRIKNSEMQKKTVE